MKILVGSDHAGYKVKERIKKKLKELGYEFEDYGTDSEDSVDYSDYGLKVAEDVAKKNTRGILVCGTGIGMCMTANKVKGIRAALAHDELTAKMSREHNNSNVLCLGGRTDAAKNAEKIAETWLKTEFSNGDRHKRRLKKIADYEND